MWRFVLRVFSLMSIMRSNISFGIDLATWGMNLVIIRLEYHQEFIIFEVSKLLIEDC